MTIAVTHRHISMGDVDQVLAFYGRYFYWMDDGMHELLRVLGHPLRAVLEGDLGMPVVDTRCVYESSVDLDDVVRVETAVVAAPAHQLRHRARDDRRRSAGGPQPDDPRLDHEEPAVQPAAGAGVAGWLRGAAGAARGLLSAGFMPARARPTLRPSRERQAWRCWRTSAEDIASSGTRTFRTSSMKSPAIFSQSSSPGSNHL